MTLRKTVVPVPIGGGLKEAQHEDLFDPPSHSEVVNVTYDDRGALLKRWGSTSLPALSPSTSTYGQHSTVAEHQGRAVVLTHEKPYVHDEVRGTWTSLGATSPMPSLTRCDPLARGNHTLFHPDSAVMTYGGKLVMCTVWSDQDIDRCYYQISELPDDERPPQVVYGPTVFSSNMNRAPRVVSVGSRFLVSAVDINGTSIRGSWIDVASSYAASASVLLSGYYNSGITTPSRNHDLVTNGTNIWTVFRVSLTDTRVRKYDSSFATVATIDVPFVHLAACYHAANDKILITSASLTIRVVPSDCSGTGATVTPTGISASLTITRSTITEAPNGGVYAAWTTASSRTAPGTVVTNDCVHVRLNSVYGTTYSGVIPGQLSVAGRAKWDGSSREPVVPMVDLVAPEYARHGWLCRPVVDESSAYSLRPIAQYGHDVVSTWGSDIGSLYNQPTSYNGNVLPSLMYADDQWLMSYQVLSFAASQEGAGYTLHSVDFLRCREVDSRPLRHVSAQNLRCFAGGAGLAYTDSVALASMTPPVCISGGGGGYDTDADYGSSSPIYGTHYVALAYRWTDAAGNVHRGLPINEFEVDATKLVTLSGGLYYPNRRGFPRPFPFGVVGSKADQKYEVEVYCGNTQGQLYFVGVAIPKQHPTYPSHDYIILGPSAVPAWSAYTAQVPPYFISLPDPDGAGPARWSEVELGHIQPPAAVDVCSTQDRVWLLSAERGRTDVWPSKLLERGYAPEFPSSLTIRLPNEGGEAVAIAALDDKIIVFKERQIYAIFGSPGDNTGSNSTLQRPRLISGDVGCLTPTSVVEGPYGIVFLGQRGFHLLDRGLNTTYIGNDVERTFIPRDNVITSGTLIPDRKQVRWTFNEATLTSDTAKAIVWSYDADIMSFSTFDTVSAVSAAARRGQWIRIARGGSVLADNTAHTSSDSFSTSVTTAWIKAAGLQGFARIYTALFLFKWFTGYIKIEVGYDHDPDWIDAVQWTNGELGALAEPNNGRVQLMVYPTRQKCEAIRFRISEVNPGGQNPPPRGAGHELVGLSLEVGRKASNFRKGLGADNKR